MVWGAVRAGGKRILAFCDQNGNQHFYQQLLRKNLSSIYSTRYFFQQDGATAHTAASTIDFLQANQSSWQSYWRNGATFQMMKYSISMNQFLDE